MRKGSTGDKDFMVILTYTSITNKNAKEHITIFYAINDMNTIYITMFIAGDSGRGGEQLG